MRDLTLPPSPPLTTNHFLQNITQDSYNVLRLRSRLATTLPPRLHGLLHRPNPRRKSTPLPPSATRFLPRAEQESDTDGRLPAALPARRLSELRVLPRARQFLRRGSGMHVAGLRGTHYARGSHDELGGEVAEAGGLCEWGVRRQGCWNGEWNHLKIIKDPCLEGADRRQRQEMQSSG